MRAAALSSARESRGERTLMGIGPEFIRRESVSEEISGTLDGVPMARTDRTPSSPIVVEPQAYVAGPAPTTRNPIARPARTVELPIAPAATVQIPIEEMTLPPGRSKRLDSVVSSRFFQEGERQEANGWEDSPLAIEPSPDEGPAFSSFDRIPRKRGPLVVTTFILGVALVIGFAVRGAGAGAARTWLATETGQGAARAWSRAWNKAKTGLTIRLTPEDTVASARAMAPATPVAAPTAVQVPAPSPSPAPPAVAAAPIAAVPAAAVPGIPAEARPRRPIALAPRAELAVAHSAEDPALDQTRPPSAVLENQHPTPVAPAAVANEGVAVAAPTEPRSIDTPERRVIEPARRGLVWSPEEQRLVPAQQASADSPPADTDKPAAQTGKAPVDPDKTVLPLDDEAHTTF